MAQALYYSFKKAEKLSQSPEEAETYQTIFKRDFFFFFEVTSMEILGRSWPL